MSLYKTACTLFNFTFNHFNKRDYRFSCGKLLFSWENIIIGTFFLISFLKSCLLNILLFLQMLSLMNFSCFFLLKTFKYLKWYLQQWWEQIWQLSALKKCSTVSFAVGFVCALLCICTFSWFILKLWQIIKFNNNR